MIEKLPNEIKIIQTLRGFSALGVVLCHLWYHQREIIINPLLNRLSDGGTYGVQIFFIISGFILPYSVHKKNYNVSKFVQFLKKRLIRLEPTYLFSILLTLFLSRFSTKLNVDIHNIKNIFLHFFYLVPFSKGSNWIQAVYWSLSVEFQFYIIIALIIPFLINKKTNKLAKHSLLIALCLLSFVDVNRSICIRWFTFFCTGISLFLYITKLFNKRDLLFHFTIYSFINWMVFKSLPFIIVLIIIPLIINKFLYTEKVPLQSIGRISYSLYLIHVPIGFFFTELIINSIGELSPFEQLLTLVIILLLSIYFSFIIYRYIEKPFVDYSKKIKF